MGLKGEGRVARMLLTLMIAEGVFEEEERFKRRGRRAWVSLLGNTQLILMVLIPSDCRIK
jgi:hypothetical protein